MVWADVMGRAGTAALILGTLHMIAYDAVNHTDY